MARSRKNPDPSTDPIGIEPERESVVGLHPSTVRHLHNCVNLCHEILPENRSVVPVDAIVSLIETAMAAYQSQTGLSYLPDSL